MIQDFQKQIFYLGKPLIFTNQHQLSINFYSLRKNNDSPEKAMFYKLLEFIYWSV